jgi:hypothetical protein
VSSRPGMEMGMKAKSRSKMAICEGSPEKNHTLSQNHVRMFGIVSPQILLCFPKEVRFEDFRKRTSEHDFQRGECFILALAPHMVGWQGPLESSIIIIEVPWPDWILLDS